MATLLISITGLLLVFFVVVAAIKIKNRLTWKSAFKETLEYFWLAS